MLPVQNLPGPVSEPLAFTVECEGPAGIETHPVRARRSRSGVTLTEPVEVTLVKPASSYRFRLCRETKELGSWEHPGVRPDRPCLIFADHGRQADAPLERKPHWVAVPSDAEIHAPGAVILESGPLFGWSGWMVYHLDLAPADALHLQPANGEPLEVPIEVESALTLELQGEPLELATTWDGAPIYGLGPPTLLIRCRSDARPDLWSIAVQPLPGSMPGQFRCGAADELGVVAADRGGAVEWKVWLGDERLLGFDAAGRFRMKVRGPSVDRRLEFAVAPGITVKPARQVFAPVRPSDDDPACVILGGQAHITFEPLPPARVERIEHDRLTVATEPDQTEVRGILRLPSPGEDAWLPLQIAIPRICWRLRGSGGAAPEEWRARIEELPLSLWDRPGDLHLIVRVPHGLGRQSTLTVVGALQQAKATIRRGEAVFDLKAFGDTLREGRARRETPPLRTFQLAAAGLDTPINLFHVRVRWDVTQLDCAVEGEGEERRLVMRWTESGQAGDRVVRIWRLGDSPELVICHPVPDGAQEATVRMPADILTAGQYLVEIAAEDPWRTEDAPFPGQNAPNTVVVYVEETPAEVPGEGYLLIHEVWDCDTQTGYPLRDRHFVSLYDDRTGLAGDQHLGRVTIVRRSAGRTEQLREDPVRLEYDPVGRCITLLEDRDGDGAMFCCDCNRLIWSQHELVDCEKQHRDCLLGPIDRSVHLKVDPAPAHVEPDRRTETEEGEIDVAEPDRRYRGGARSVPVLPQDDLPPQG